MSSLLRYCAPLLLVLTGCATTSPAPRGDSPESATPRVEVLTREERIAVDPASHTFVLRNPHGDVRLRTIDQPTVGIYATIQRIGENPLDPTFDIRQRDGVFELTIRYPDETALLARGDHGYGRVDMGVWVPARMALDVETTDGLLQVRRASAPVRARTTSGELQVTAASGLDLASVTGDIAFRQFTGQWDQPIVVRADQGHVYANVPAFADVELLVHAGGRIESQSGLPQATAEKTGGMRLQTHFGTAQRMMRIDAPKGDVYLYRVVPDAELATPEDDAGSR